MPENLMQIAGDLKMLQDSQLQQILQSPGSPAPQFLVLGELQDREKQRAAASAQQQQNPTTVAQDVMASQQQGNPMTMTRGGMPNQMQRFADGGAVEPTNALSTGAAATGGIGGIGGTGVQQNYNLDGAKSLATLNRANPAAGVRSPSTSIPFPFSPAFFQYLSDAGGKDQDWSGTGAKKQTSSDLKKFADGGPVASGGLAGAADSVEKDYGLGKSLADLNGRAPGSTTVPAQPGADPMAGYSDVIKALNKQATTGVNSFGSGLQRIAAMQQDPEGYKSYVGMMQKKEPKRGGMISFNDGGMVRPRFAMGYADGGQVGGDLVPLSRDPVTGKVRFGG